MDKKLERSNADKALRRLTNQIKPLGFVRTKPTFWVREREHLVQFIHIHKYTFGPLFRIHTCVRPLNSNLEFVALFGPIEQELNAAAKFEYTEETSSVESCASAMSQFISTFSEEWYSTLGTTTALLSSESVLDAQEKMSLRQSLDGKAKTSNNERTRLLLKIA
ncbi:hypothetical protein ALT761_02385 [Alteromonas sp. 76-1]|jgi:hypothetical protein|uniref:hypothetical protein n=1 Tax=Alteromonas sp. 76-1 TaxID=2358187 RepID=UPI000FD183AA|nr:hypothetical protein [Alteromonas sp. 76-1]VEL97381.1 hypothetical protein ALT761_02385 [Alteromonas sp. 76-1]